MTSLQARSRQAPLLRMASLIPCLRSTYRQQRRRAWTRVQPPGCQPQPRGSSLGVRPPGQRRGHLVLAPRGAVDVVRRRVRVQPAAPL